MAWNNYLLDYSNCGKFFWNMKKAVLSRSLMSVTKKLQVAVYMVRKLLPVVTTHHHALKTAIARNWEVEEEVDGVRIQV